MARHPNKRQLMQWLDGEADELDEHVDTREVDRVEVHRMLRIIEIQPLVGGDGAVANNENFGAAVGEHLGAVCTCNRSRQLDDNQTT